jgi:hypothetical protein
MRIADGRWCCEACGGRIDGVPLSKIPVGEQLTVPGKAVRRVLRVDGRIVHRCELQLDGAPDRNAAAPRHAAT